MLSLIGTKLGMTQVFDEAGFVTPVTVIKIEENVVIAKRTLEKNGYEACVTAAVAAKASRVSKPYAGQFPEGVAPKRLIAEQRDFGADKEVGDKLGVELLESCDFVDVIGSSKGKGYQGVMKRHGFGGGRATHGSKFHREPGGTGMCATPARVFKGTKMPGRMGGERVTVQNLAVVRVDSEKQIILVKGAVPGPTNGIVYVREAKKK